MIEPAAHPAWPTTMMSRLRDGRLMGVDGSVWVYRSVPMSPVTDAKTPTDAVRAAEPLLAAFEEMAAMTNFTMSRRSMARGSYRQVHLLLINVPQLYSPDRSHPLAEYLRSQYGHMPIDRRVLLLGTQLQARVGGAGGMRAAIDSITETLVSGGTPLADYDADFAKINAAMDHAGLSEPTVEELRLANGWWNHGDFPDTPLLIHADHLHVFNSASAVRIAEAAGVQDCSAWDEKSVPQHAVSFTSVQDLDLGFVPTTEPLAAWMSQLVEAGALVVSVRGEVEPSSITRAELRRQRKRYIDDINERVKQNKMERAEQSEMLEILGQVESMYATGKAAPPTLTGASVVAGFDGQIGDVNTITSHHAPAKLSMMLYRQPGAMAETMLCSNVRANPNLHDLPTQAVACSGMPSLNLVGDPDGALVGFTERDRQPAYLSPSAASAGDASPICVVPGQTGSGKSVLMLNLADQFARAGRPVVVWDPKQESDHSAVVEASVPGSVYSLDRLLEADGVFDPIRFSATKEVGVELAASMLMAINPWGDYKNNMEVPLQHALSYGVEKGAECIGQALKIASADLDLPDGLVSRVEVLAASSAQFRAIVGMEPRGEGLKAAKGITLIKVGSAYLDLPQPGQEPASLQQKVALALVRMVVFGSAMAVSGRDGVVMLDEAWIVLGAGAAEVERLGRLARSQSTLR